MKIATKLILISMTSLVLAYNPNEDLDKANLYLTQNRINLAIAAAERVLMYDENNQLANFYLAQAYAKMKDVTLAKKYLKKLKQPTPKMQKFIAEFYKKYPDRNIKFDINIMVGMNFDSNINNETDAEHWNIYINNNKQTIHNYSTKEYAISGYELLTIDPIYKYKGYNIHNNLTLYNKNVIDHSDRDIFLVDYSPFITQTLFQKYNLSHILNYNYMMYADKSYIHKFAIAEKLKFDFFNNHTSITKVSFDYTHYLNSANSNNDCFNFGIDSKVIKHLNHINLDLGVGYLSSSAKESSQKLSDYNSYKVNFGLNATFFNYLIGLKTNYTHKEYQNENPLFHKTQLDKKIDYQFAINRYGFLTYQTKFEYIRNISNIEPYSYNKWILSINIIKTFKGL